MHMNVPLRFYINKIYWANIVFGLVGVGSQWIGANYCAIISV